MGVRFPPLPLLTLCIGCVKLYLHASVTQWTECDVSTVVDAGSNPAGGAGEYTQT